MTPKELFWLIDAKRPRKRYGHLSEEEVDELIEDAKANGVL